MRIGQRGATATALLTAALVGCNGGGASSSGPGAPVLIDGSSTVFRISNEASERYTQDHPGARVIVNFSGTGGGFGKYTSEGDLDIVDASRPAKPAEEDLAKQKGYDWTRFLVGHDGITVVVNPQNQDIPALTVEQLKKLWSPDSSVKTWKDLDPAWPDRKIVLYSPDRDSGTFEFFTEAIVGAARSQRQDDVQMSADDNVLVKGVEEDKDGLGYFGFAYYAANQDRLRAVPVQNGPDASPVLPSHESILANSYTPLSRPLFIYVKNSSMKRPEVQEFITYYLDHVAELAEAAGYVAPTAEEQAANHKALAPLASSPPQTAAR